MKRTIKFKPVKLPPCPRAQEARQTFMQANGELRDARERYKLACYEASMSLKGERLLRFVLDATHRAFDNGLYSASTAISDVAWNMIRFFYRREMGSRKATRYGQWDWWQNDRGIPCELWWKWRDAHAKEFGKRQVA